MKKKQDPAIPKTLTNNKFFFGDFVIYLVICFGVYGFSTLFSSAKGLRPLLEEDCLLSGSASEIGRKLIRISPSICLAGEARPLMLRGATVSANMEALSENGDVSSFPTVGE